MSHVKQMFHKILLNILSFVGTQQIEISCKSLTERLTRNKTTAHQSSLFNSPVIHHSDDVAVSFVNR